MKVMKQTVINSVTVVYTTDRSKAVVLVSYFVWLCGFYTRAFSVASCLALCSRVFSVLFSIVITLLGEVRAGLFAFHHLFVVVVFFFVFFFFCTR